MRIAYVCESTLPSRTANSIQVMRMCRALAAQGHDVTLLAPSRSDGREEGADLRGFYGVSGDFAVELLPWPNLPFRSIVFCLAIARAARRLRPDLIYSRSIHGGLLPALLGYPVTLEAHVPVWECSRLVAAALRLLTCTGRVRKLVVVTHSLKDVYAARGYLPSRDILVAPNGSEPIEPARACDDWPGRPGALQVGYVGHLFPGKGMEVVARVAPRMPDVDFHVVGGTEHHLAEWRARVAAPNLHFHGYVRQPDVPSYLARLDVCLLPNQRKVSGWDAPDALDIAAFTSPLKMFEYMAHRKAIVASDLPVLREVLHERVALLVDPEDDEAWIAAIRRLSDPDLRATLAENAWREFMQRYTTSARSRAIVAQAMQ